MADDSCVVKCLILPDCRYVRSLVVRFLVYGLCLELLGAALFTIYSMLKIRIYVFTQRTVSVVFIVLTGEWFPFSAIRHIQVPIMWLTNFTGDVD